MLSPRPPIFPSISPVPGSDSITQPCRNQNPCYQLCNIALIALLITRQWSPRQGRLPAALLAVLHLMSRQGCCPWSLNPSHLCFLSPPQASVRPPVTNSSGTGLPTPGIARSVAPRALRHETPGEGAMKGRTRERALTSPTGAVTSSTPAIRARIQSRADHLALIRPPSAGARSNRRWLGTRWHPQRRAAARAAGCAPGPWPLAGGTGSALGSQREDDQPDRTRWARPVCDAGAACAGAARQPAAPLAPTTVGTSGPENTRDGTRLPAGPSLYDLGRKLAHNRVMRVARGPLQGPDQLVLNVNNKGSSSD